MEDGNIILKGAPFLFSAIGATMVVIGSIMMMDEVEGYIGNMIFLAGWIVFLFSLLNKEHQAIKDKETPNYGTMTQSTFMGIIGGMLIVFSELMLQQTGESAGEGFEGLISSTPGILALVGWIVLALSIASEPGFYIPRVEKLLVTIPAASLIIVSLLLLIPQQASEGNPFGLGIPFLILGWTGLVFANSMKFPSLPQFSSDEEEVVEEVESM